MDYSKAAKNDVSRHTLKVKRKKEKKKGDLKEISLCSVNKQMSIPLEADISIEILTCC